MNPKHRKFIGVAEAIASLSKDRSTRVGAVVLGPGSEIRSVGYNGMPRGVNDGVESRHERPAKYRYTAHAEENAIAQAARSGVSLDGCTLLVTSLFPCSTCARLIIQSGIKEVIAPYQAIDTVRWGEEAAVSCEMLTEAGVEVHRYTP